jgi:peptide/nickel transport system substrate-binding protein
LKDIVTDWQDLFGGGAGGLLERAAFPKFADDPKPNLKNEMQESIPFSGGPWILRSFGLAQAVLVRNERYYGKVPLLDQITFVPMNAIDPSSRIRGLLNGQVAAVHIFPFEEEVLGQLSGHPNVMVTTGDEFYVEVMWFNHESPPLDDVHVRNAIMYAIDRQAVVDRFAKPNNPQARVPNCGLLALPSVGPWCLTQPFEGFTYDPVKAKGILESDGYDCSSLPCTKRGRRLVVEYAAVSTNPVRAGIRQLLKEKGLAAGFDLRIKNYEGGVLFTDVAARGAFTMAEAASFVSPDPSVSFSLACESIPTKANGFKGSNWARWCNRRATDLMHQADRELDPDRRLQLMNQVYALEAQNFVSLPLYVSPVVAAWRTDKIAGPIGDFNSSPYGLFFNVNEWYKVRGN